MSPADEAPTQPTATQTSRKRKPTERQRAINSESLESANKKIKVPEDQLKELTGMNQDLRTFIKEKFREPEKAASPEFSGDTLPMVFIKKKTIQQPLILDHPATAYSSRDPSTNTPTAEVNQDYNTGSQSTPTPGPTLPHADEPPRPWPPAPFAPGVDNKKTKTANKEYGEVVARMLTTTEHDFACQIFTENAYPDLSTQVRWSIECWEAVCNEEGQYFELSSDMRNLIKGRCLHARGAILTQIRPIIDSLFDSSGISRAIKKVNAATHNSLLEKNSFYYQVHVHLLQLFSIICANGAEKPQNTSQRMDQFGNEQLRNCIRKAFFSGEKSELARYKDKFNPIPLPSIALVCTLFEHCVQEWSTGVQKKASLEEVRDRGCYKKHFENVKKWAALKPETTNNILTKMFKKFISTCGINFEDPEASDGAISDGALEAERQALEGQTGLSESEPEDDEF